MPVVAPAVLSLVAQAELAEEEMAGLIPSAERMLLRGLMGSVAVAVVYRVQAQILARTAAPVS